MKRFTYPFIAALILSGATLSAEPGAGKKYGKHGDVRGDVDTRGRDVSVHVAFSNGDLRVIREYYEPRYRNLPPGLQKKLARTGQLPPGWQKKLQPFPVIVERELVVLPAGYRRGLIDGQAVIYDSHTHVIVDVAVLF